MVYYKKALNKFKAETRNSLIEKLINGINKRKIEDCFVLGRMRKVTITTRCTSLGFVYSNFLVKNRNTLQ